MLSGTFPNANRDLFDVRTTVAGVHRSRLSRVIIALTALGFGAVATACGPASSDSGWAKATALTCASTIARARLRPPTASQIAEDRFLQERQRLLESHRAFNTVTPFRNVCSRIRDEIRADAAPSTTISPESADPNPADRDS